jgi:periplasmic nitrate reductase NapD
MSCPIHIAGLVVHIQPARMAEVHAAIRALPGAEVHSHTETGKTVVTLEADDAALIGDQLNAIHAIEGVLAAALVYEAHEEEGHEHAA